MSKKGGAPAPDYTAAANAQAQASKENTTEQTWANRPNQNSPFGSISWDAQQTIDPATGRPVTQWTQNTTLDPTLQRALDSQMALQQGRSDLAGSMLGQVQQSMGQPLDYSRFAAMSQGPGATTTTPTTGGAYSFGAQPIDTSRMASPQLQTQLGQFGNVQTGLDFGGVQGLDSAAATRQRAEDAAYASQASRLDPRFDAQQRKLETQLANQGISRNSQAYTRAMDDFNRSKTDAYQQAQLGAIGIGGQEASRDYGMNLQTRQQQVGELGQQGQFANQAQAQMFGQGLQGAQFGNQALGAQFGQDQSAAQQQLAAQNALYQQQLGAGNFGLQQQNQAFNQGLASNNQNFAQQMQQSQYQNQLRQQQIAEALQQRGLTLNEMNALLSGQQVSSPQFQNFSQAGRSDTADLMGAAQNQYAAAQNAQSSRNAAFGDILGGFGSIAGMMFSDARVKRDIRRIGTHARGFGIYEFRYVGERLPRVGVLAQEVRRVMPEAVAANCGVLMVDYSKLGGVAA